MDGFEAELINKFPLREFLGNLEPQSSPETKQEGKVYASCFVTRLSLAFWCAAPASPRAARRVPGRLPYLYANMLAWSPGLISRDYVMRTEQSVRKYQNNSYFSLDLIARYKFGQERSMTHCYQDRQCTTKRL